MTDYTNSVDLSDGERVEYTPPLNENVANGPDNYVTGVLKTVYSDYDYHFTIAFNVNGNLNLQPIYVTNFDDLLIEVEGFLEGTFSKRIQEHLISTQHPPGEVAPYLLSNFFNHPKFAVRQIRVTPSETEKLDEEEKKTTIDPEDLANLIRELGYAVVLASPKKLKGESPKDFEKKIQQRYRL